MRFVERSPGTPYRLMRKIPAKFNRPTGSLVYYDVVGGYLFFHSVALGDKVSGVRSVICFTKEYQKDGFGVMTRAHFQYIWFTLLIFWAQTNLKN